MRLLHAARHTCLVLATIALAGCLPPPIDIGSDYSGPMYRKPGADAPRVVTDAPVLPVTAGTDCQLVTETPTRKRSDCGVRLVMDRYNPGLQSLYQQRLANEPMLKGNVTLRLSIAADGGVTAVDVASSELRDPEFIRQVLAYVRTLGFGAVENVPVWADTYAVEFTPPQDVIPDKPGGPKIAPAGSTK